MAFCTKCGKLDDNGSKNTNCIKCGAPLTNINDKYARQIKQIKTEQLDFHTGLFTYRYPLLGGFIFALKRKKALKKIRKEKAEKDL